MDTIIEVIEKKLNEFQSKTSFTFLVDGENPTSPFSLFDLRKSSLNLATVLPKNKAVLLLLPQGISFIQAFFGCLYAQAVAVPVSLPTKNRGLEKIKNIVEDAEISIGITTRSILANLQKWFGEDYSTISIKWLFIEDFTEENSFDFGLPKPQQLAFLQYTSGSTAKPKAVMVTHENIIANSKIIQKCFQNTSESVSVCWLPSFHDMGLIDGIIQPIFSGFPSVLMSPAHFLQRPARWFKAITKYRATYSGGPNFAFDFCVERIRDDELTNIDLSSLRCLYNGSEPIRAKTIHRFIERFSSVGFNEQKIFSCYGLAEATLAVTTSKLGTSPKIINSSSSELVSCGGVYEDTNLKIVNPETKKECQENEVGEIWVSGKSITSGYLNRPNQTAETFVKFENERFLRTGDLGFLEKDELFVTGRIKDLIIIRGKNHYPQDIEHTVFNAHPSLQSNSCAAFSFESDGDEKLVIVQEIKRTFLQAIDFESVLNLILAEISQNHGLNPIDIVLIRPGNLPKTTSGKIQRVKCRLMWLELRLNSIAKLSEYRK